MKKISIDGLEYACPFWDLVRPHTDLELSNLTSEIRIKNKIVLPVVYYISPRWGHSLVDGMTRATIGVSYQIEIPLLRLKVDSDEEARDWALALNVARRHLSIEEQSKAREERIMRAVIARASGASLRQIAAQENVSAQQIRRDLEEAASDRKHRVIIDVKVQRTSCTLAKTVDKYLGSPTKRNRLRAIAQANGIPLSDDGKSWPALDLILATLRDATSAGAVA